MDLLIFDLDGTLIDSKLDLAHAVREVIRIEQGLTACVNGQRSQSLLLIDEVLSE